MQKLIREPLLHFFVLGALLFTVFALVDPDQFSSPNEIVIDEQRTRILAAQFERVRQRPPTPEEQAGLIEAWLREEIFYREGIALGIDQGDRIVRRRISQKMAFMAESLVDDSFTDEDLQTWLDDHKADYAAEPEYSFTQTYIYPEKHGANLAAVIESTRTDLANGKPTGDRTSLPAGLATASVSEITRHFGQEFADSLSDVPMNEWHGPLRSSYGLHFVLISEKSEGRLRELSEIRDIVERDFISQRTAEASEEFYQALKNQYNIKYPDDKPAT